VVEGHFLRSDKRESSRKSAENAGNFEQNSKFLKFFFIHFYISTYAQTMPLKYPNFRIKRAGISNYRGIVFFIPGQNAVMVIN